MNTMDEKRKLCKPRHPVHRMLSAILMAAPLFLLPALFGAASGLAGMTEEEDEANSPNSNAPAFDKTEQQAQNTRNDPANPRRHFRVPNAANLAASQLIGIYKRLLDDMSAGYGISGNPVAKSYRKWKKYNKTPYLSSSHGRRYLNNYANRTAMAYGRFEKAGTMPVGSIIAKDSFTVTEDGTIAPGSLYIMEKMQKGFNYVSGDWRYTMIMPDGSIFGATLGENSQKVKFCISCHLAAQKTDHLRFIPNKYRVRSD